MMPVIFGSTANLVESKILTMSNKTDYRLASLAGQAGSPRLPRWRSGL